MKASTSHLVDLLSDLSISDDEGTLKPRRKYIRISYYLVLNVLLGWDDYESESDGYWTADEVPSVRQRVNSLRVPGGMFFLSSLSRHSLLARQINRVSRISMPFLGPREGSAMQVCKPRRRQAP